MKSLLAALLAAALVACSPNPGSGLDASFAGIACQDFFSESDGGSVGSASQLLPVARASADAWKQGLALTSLMGTVGADGSSATDGGSWNFQFSTVRAPPSLASVQATAEVVAVTGLCVWPSGSRAAVSWTVDSSAAFATAADAGCPLGPVNRVELRALSDPTSPLFDVDPAWIINAHGDGGAVECVVDATTGAYGVPPPDGGATDGGAAPSDAGSSDAGADAGASDAGGDGG